MAVASLVRRCVVGRKFSEVANFKEIHEKSTFVAIKGNNASEENLFKIGFIPVRELERDRGAAERQANLMRVRQMDAVCFHAGLRMGPSEYRRKRRMLEIRNTRYVNRYNRQR